MVGVVVEGEVDGEGFFCLLFAHGGTFFFFLVELDLFLRLFAFVTPLFVYLWVLRES